MNCRLVCICLILALILSFNSAAASGNLRESDCLNVLEKRWQNRKSVEYRIWSSVCHRRTANLSTGTAPDRLVTNDFLHTILTQKRYVEAIPHTGVVIHGAIFNDDVILDGVRFDRPIKITGSHFKRPLNMDDAQFGALIAFSGSDFDDTVSALRAHFDGGLDFSGSTAVSVMLDHVHAKKAVRFEGAILTEKLEFRGGHVEGLVSIAALDNQFPSAFKLVALTSTRITGPLHLYGAVVTEELNLNDVKVEDSIVARATSSDFWSQFTNVNLTGASVGGQLDLRGVIVTDALQMNSIDVGQHLLMNSFMHRATFHDVILTGAKIAGELAMVGTEIEGKLSLNSAKIGQHALFNGIPGKENVHATIPSSFGSVDASLVSVGGGVAMYAAHFSGPVNFDSADIKSTLRLSYKESDKKPDVGPDNASPSGPEEVLHPQWGDDATLSLRGARAGSVHDWSGDAGSTSWPRKLELHGLEFSHWHASETSGQNPRPSRDIKWYKTWLEADETFTSHPYLHLARLLERNESGDAAREVRILLDDIRRDGADGLEWLWLTALKYTVCYGHDPFRALYWAGALILISMFVLHCSGEREKHEMKYGFSYSLDLLLPAIQLDKRHYDTVRLKDGIRHGYYVYMIAGYVLFGFVIAGLARVTE